MSPRQATQSTRTTMATRLDAHRTALHEDRDTAIEDAKGSVSSILNPRHAVLAWRGSWYRRHYKTASRPRWTAMCSTSTGWQKARIPSAWQNWAWPTTPCNGGPWLAIPATGSNASRGSPRPAQRNAALPQPADVCGQKTQELWGPRFTWRCT